MICFAPIHATGIGASNLTNCEKDGLKTSMECLPSLQEARALEQACLSRAHAQALSWHRWAPVHGDPLPLLADASSRASPWLLSPPASNAQRVPSITRSASRRGLASTHFCLETRANTD